MQHKADPSKPRELACKNSGIWFQIEDGGNIADSMASYYTLYAEGMSDTEVVRWSDYEGAFTKERLIAGCLLRCVSLDSREPWVVF